MPTVTGNQLIIEIMETEFATWLTGEMDRRGWSNSELARRAGVVPSTLSKIITGYNQPGIDLCNGLARALNLPPELIFRRAGLLPKLPAPDQDATLSDLLDIARRLGKTERKTLAGVARVLLEQRNDYSDYRTGDERPGNSEDPNEEQAT